MTCANHTQTSTIVYGWSISPALAPVLDATPGDKHGADKVSAEPSGTA